MDIEKIKKDISLIISECDLKPFSITYKKDDEKNVLEVIVDKVGFVDISDVEDVTNKINEYLDKEDPIEEEYSLEVLSRGLEKEFEFDDAYAYVGEWIEVKTMDQLYKGFLQESVSDAIIIKNEKNKTIKINANDIISLKIAVKF